MAKSKTKLKDSLKTQQNRLKKKQQAAQAEASYLAADKARSGSKGKKPMRPTIPFLPTDTILLVGEGDFSFARALVVDPPSSLQFLPATNITATTIDTEEETYSKYSESRAIISDLRARGVDIRFGVDATKLDTALKNMRMDRIVFNFPHEGRGITDQDRNIRTNQELMLGFLRSASRLLREGPIPQVFTPRKRKKRSDDSDDEEPPPSPSGTEQAGTKPRGTILITLRNVPPYTLWDVPKLAKNPPSASDPKYMVLRSFAFHRSIWKGYKHQMTKGERVYQPGQGGEDRTWEFCIST